MRLDKKRTTTDCDGKYRGERYFRCTAGHGLYIPRADAEYAGGAGAEAQLVGELQVCAPRPEGPRAGRRVQYGGRQPRVVLGRQVVVEVGLVAWEREAVTPVVVLSHTAPPSPG